MKRLFKATVILGSATIIANFVKIVNTKFLAIFLGPSGVGVFYQLVFFMQLAYLFTCFGTRMGVTKYLSELKTRQDHESIQVIVLTCIVFLLFFSFLTSTTAFLYAGAVSRFLFGTAEYANYIQIIVFAIPIGVLMDFGQGILFGFRMVNSIAAYNLSESILCAAVFLPLIYFLGLDGAIVSIITTYSIQLFLVIYIIKRYSAIPISFNIFKRVLIKFPAITKVIRYGAVSLIITFARDLSLTILFRKLIISHLGIEANGIYAPAFGISFQIWLLVAVAMYAYSFSRISEAKDNAEICMEVNHLIRTVLLIVGPIIFILIGFRSQVILLLYTGKFLPVTKIMPIQFLGDFFKLLVLSISLPIHARADLKAMFFYEIGIYLFFYLTAYTLIPSMGLMGTGWSYFLMYLVYFIVVTPYVVKKFHLRLERKNIWMMITSFLLLLIGSQLKMNLSGMFFVSIVLLAAWAVLSLTREEWEFGWRKSKEYLGKATQFLKSS
jgi:O-antigen/teichoic acid export membrane protein